MLEVFVASASTFVGLMSQVNAWHPSHATLHNLQEYPMIDMLDSDSTIRGFHVCKETQEICYGETSVITSKTSMPYSVKFSSNKVSRMSNKL